MAALEPTYLKAAPWHAPTAAADVRARVSELLLEIDRDRETAVRRISERLDQWAPMSFVVEATEIKAAATAVDGQLAAHIAFAQEQVRAFAGAQLATLGSLEIAFRLDGCHVLITGASRGIGAAIALAFASAGAAKLTLIARDRQALHEIAGFRACSGRRGRSSQL